MGLYDRYYFEWIQFETRENKTWAVLRMLLEE